MKHTPGPWRITNHGLSKTEKRSAFHRHQIGTHEKTVAYTWSPIKKPTAEHNANARLISAAPELLKALDAVLGEYSDLQSDTFGMSNDQTDACIQARAAIEKATSQ